MQLSMGRRRKKVWKIWMFPFDSPYIRRVSGGHGVNIDIG